MVNIDSFTKHVFADTTIGHCPLLILGAAFAADVHSFRSFDTADLQAIACYFVAGYIVAGDVDLVSFGKVAKYFI